MSDIDVRDVSRSFTVDGHRLVALDGIAFDVPAASMTSIVGPNGSGKSTLLRLIGGLLAPDSGHISVGGRMVTGPGPHIGICFQEPRLLPWRGVLDNIALPMELAGVPADERRARARELIDLVGLAGFDQARPHQLSGGMRQRAALARALALRPSVLLLDEPFSALDALTRERLDEELQALWAQTATTIVLVTHDIPEACFLADRVLVLSARPGRVVADIPVAQGRPRRREDPAASQAASAVRAALERSGTPVAEVAA